MKKIAILGGSFNPFHNGHAAMIDAVRKWLSPEEIWLMPAKKPPHKPSYGYISDNDRINMLQVFSQDYDDVSVCKKEISMTGFTYTFQTMKELCKENIDVSFYFIIGGDSIENFKNWYKPDVIVSCAEIVVCARNSNDKSRILKITGDLEKTIGGIYHILNFEPIDISSTDIRERIKEKKDISNLVPLSVYRYISEHKLYIGDDKEFSFEALKMEISKKLPEKRYLHTLGVVETAEKLAARYNVDILKAKTAAILHDCAKPLSGDEMKNLCDQNGLEYTKHEISDEQTTQSLLHSKAGMIIAQNCYYISDAEILSAIYHHTVGRPNMSELEKIIYVADYIEPGRKQNTTPPLDKIRKIAFEDIDKAVYLISKNTIEYLSKSKRIIDKKTEEMMRFYKNNE